MRSRRRLLPLVVLPVIALGCGGAEQEPELFTQAGQVTGAAPFTLSADARDTGYIRLRLTAAAGVRVDIEDTGRPLTTITPTAAQTQLRRAAPWRCDVRNRTFTARTADGRSATARVRTPGCGKRLALSAPRRTRAGRAVPLALVDRWRLGGFRARLCVSPPGGDERCRSELIRSGRGRAQTSFRALRPGGWRVRLVTPWAAERRAVRAAPRGGRLRLLATGDSMIQIIDSYLKQRLEPRGVRVRSDAHISTGISKPSLLDWQRQARRHAGGAPDVVVMFLGANDGFAMGSADCCGAAWVAEYGRRARRMMQTYGRGGRTRIYWLLLPTPRRGFFRESFPAVNQGILRAARGLGRDVRVIDLVEIFTPGGRYRDSMRIGNRVVRVRQGDGVHLNTAGASLAASVIISTLRRERILR